MIYFLNMDDFVDNSKVKKITGLRSLSQNSYALTNAFKILKLRKVRFTQWRNSGGAERAAHVMGGKFLGYTVFKFFLWRSNII